jgi:hypothetical protein
MEKKCKWWSDFVNEKSRVKFVSPEPNGQGHDEMAIKTN